MLQINKLCKRYGKFQALNNLDLSIPKGEVFGFIGPNGAGKTTTMKIICGLLSATSGEVYVDGIDAIINKKEIKRKIGYMPDFFGVYDNLKAMEYMEFYASMYGIVGDGARKTCRELMALVNLSDKEDAYVDGLSRGMKQRLCLARCLVHNPELLILDEPASGLDPRARFEVKEILKNLSSMKKTIIISSHILPELAEMCTSIGVMERGHLVINGSIDDIIMNAKGSSPLHIQIVDNQETAIRLLKENPAVEKLSIRNDEIIVSYMGTEQDEANLLKQLILNDVAVSGFVREQGNLENIFMELTGPKQKEAV